MRLIDLSGDTFRQSVVDREDGLYLGHPTTALLADGKTMFTVYPKCHGFGQLVLKKSTDGGVSWSERLPVPESFSTSLECPTIYRLTDKAGKSRLFIFSGVYPFRSAVSEDDGASWSEFAAMGDYGGYFISTIIQTGNGEYLALFHDEGAFIHGSGTHKGEVWRAGSGSDTRTRRLVYDRQPDGVSWGAAQPYWKVTAEKPGDVWQKIYEFGYGDLFADGRYELYQIRSIDGGLSWSLPEMICTSTKARLCEPCMISSPDGKQLAVLLRENYRRFQSMLILSTDGGQSWSQPAELNPVLTGDRHCARYLRDGRLFISYRDMSAGSPYYGSWVAWIGRYEDIINRREGDCKLLLKKNYGGADCAYPGVELLADGTVVAVTYGKWEPQAEHYILCVRITDEELRRF